MQECTCPLRDKPAKHLLVLQGFHTLPAYHQIVIAIVASSVSASGFHGFNEFKKHQVDELVGGFRLNCGVTQLLAATRHLIVALVGQRFRAAHKNHVDWL